MVLKEVFLSFVLFNVLSLINCSELNDNLFGNLMGQRSWFDDVDADFELSRNKLSLKEKRFDNGVFSYNDKIDTSSSSDSDDGDSWHGRWLPEKVKDEPKHRVVSKRLNDTLHQDHYSSMTSSINTLCDDGKTNITVDWSGSPENYTCFQRTFISPDFNVAAFITHDYIPTEYHARHVCMSDKINYDTYLPTFGPHRPAWARYGEYTFLPVQRWLHNLEHGAIVMLYHPCTHPLLVSKLRDIVTSCLYRHVITPYTLLSEKRPLALVSWGWSMTMSYVDEQNVENFIKEHALQGFEQLSKDGDYDHMLKKPAEIITTEEDESICPNSVKQHM